MLLLIERQSHAVGQNVIYEVHAHRRRVSEIADLDRRWTVGQDCRPRLLGVALQVDSDIDIEIEQKLGHFAITAQHHVVELVERLDQPRTDLATIIGTVGDAQHFESLPIMELEQLRDLPARRMAIEGRRQVGNF